MKVELGQAVDKILVGLGIDMPSFKLEYPENPAHGDFSCNVAMIYAKQLDMAPKILAEKIITELKKYLGEKLSFVESISVDGPGFINFKIKDKVFVEEIVATALSVGRIHRSGGRTSKKVMVEYTDPNPFKAFHIGHLMSNAIGESISRLTEGSGAEVIRACYQGDVGLHVAKTIWAIQKEKERSKNEKRGENLGSVTEKVKWLGEMYVSGAKFDDDEAVQKEIAVINKKIFEKSDKDINEIYVQGRKWSLEYFDIIYASLGTKFNEFFFESEVADNGIKVVREFLKKGVFTESEGAVIFKGEDYGLHTRVFITSQGLPTYEAKEIGLNIEKFKKYPDLTESIIITANEQNDYFKVLLKAFSLIDQNIFTKTKHISHGMLRFASGKMASRKGNVISAESLLGEIKSLVMDKISDRELSPAEKEEISDIVAVGAIKYTILRQTIGSDVIFDSAASISFEGDSGPYLQYAAVRAGAVLEKGKKSSYAKVSKDKQRNKEGNNQNSQTESQAQIIPRPDLVGILPESVTLLEKLISRFPDIVEHARMEYAPQHVANYLITLAGAFNVYYATNKIIVENDPLTSYRLNLTQAFLITMTDGLWLLGIKVPKRM